MTRALHIDWSRFSVGDIERRPTASLRAYRLTEVDIPRLGDEEYAVLADQVRAHGVREPLLITPAGEVLDGQARLRAAVAAGVTDVPVRVVYADDLHDYQVLAGAALLGRRHLTASQRFAIAAALRGLIEPQARVRQREALRRARVAAPAQAAAAGASPRQSGETRALIAEAIGVSPRTAGKLQVIQRIAR